MTDFKPITNKLAMEKIAEHRGQFVAKYLTPDLNESERKVLKVGIDMGEELATKILLEFTIPIAQQLEENTLFLKRVIGWGVSVIILAITSIIGSLNWEFVIGLLGSIFTK